MGDSSRVMLALRSLIWALALAGVFATFVWPFVVSANPDDPVLMMISRGLVGALLAALAAAAVMRARRR